MNSQQFASRMLVHYFQMLAKKSGVAWNNDMTIEIELAVDAIIEAAVDLMVERQESKEHHR